MYWDATPLTVTTKIIIFSVEDPYKPLFAPLTRRGFESQDIWYHWYWFVLTHWSVLKLVHSKNWCFLHIHHQKYIKATWALMIPLQLSIRTWNVWAVSAISYQQTFTEGQFLMRFFQGFLQTLHLDMDKNEGKSGTRECSKINFWSRVVLDPHPYIYNAKTPLNAGLYNLWLISNLWNGTDQCGNHWSQAGLHDFMQCLLMLRMLIVYPACLLFPTKILRKREKPERKIISLFLSFFLSFLLSFFLAFFSLSLDTSGWLGPSSELHVSYGKTVMWLVDNLWEAGVLPDLKRKNKVFLLFLRGPSTGVAPPYLKLSPGICCSPTWMTYGQSSVHGEVTSLSRVSFYSISSAVAAPWTNLPQGIVLGWAPIGSAAMATLQPSQYYFDHT